MRNIEKYVEITNLSLVACLLSLGIPFVEETPFCTLRTHDGTKTLFYLQESSPDGRWNTKELVKAWDNPQYHSENPECPFAYVKCAFSNRDGLLDHVKQGLSLAVLEKNGKLVVISKSATPEFQKKIFDLV